VTTFAELTDAILDQLQGFTSSPNQVTSLRATITSSDLTFTVDDPNEIGKGYVEIDDEILWVKSVDPVTGQVVVAPFGRGYKGTTAAAHTAGVAVVSTPTWTRSSVKREINNQIRTVYPVLYGVRAAPAITADAITYQFNLPALAERVVDVRWKFIDLEGWQRSRAWEAEHAAPADFAGGRYVSVYDTIPPGADVQVLYACRPQPLVNDSDDFATVTGLDEGARDVIELGVMSRMARFLDVGRLSDQSVQADQLDGPRPISSATNIANDLYRQYQVRLMGEQKALSDRYPARIHRTR
jgi:hypothetical protein